MARAPVLERRFYSKGHIIVHEGDEAYLAYIIQSGCVSVFSKKDKERVEIARLEAGQIFGEMALILDEPRSASVEAIEDTNVIVITRDVFQNKLKASDSTVRAVVRMLTKRVSSSNAAVIQSKGSTFDHFIKLQTRLLDQVSDLIPDEDQRTLFRAEAFPILRQLTKVIERARDGKPLQDSAPPQDQKTDEYDAGSA